MPATLQRAESCGLQWPLPDEMSDRQLAERRFPSAPGKPAYKMPDYAYVYKEMQKSGVALNLLWLEYCGQCKASGAIPYQSTHVTLDIYVTRAQFESIYARSSANTFSEQFPVQRGDFYGKCSDR